MRTKRSRGIIIGLALVVAVGTLTTASAFLRDQSRPSHFDRDIEVLREQLANAEDPDIIASVTEKLAIAEESRRQEQDANASPVDPKALERKRNTLATEVAANDGKGVFEIRGVPAGDGEIIDLQPPLPGAQWLPGNAWRANEPKGKRTIVWAGADGADPAQGAVLVTREGPVFERIYPAPGKHGELKVESAEGRVLRLRAKDGTLVEFNVDSRTFP